MRHDICIQIVRSINNIGNIMNDIFRALTCALVFTVAAIPANASIISYDEHHSSEHEFPIGFVSNVRPVFGVESGILLFEGFDASLGTLTSIKIQIKYTTVAEIETHVSIFPPNVPLDKYETRFRQKIDAQAPSAALDVYLDLRAVCSLNVDGESCDRAFNETSTVAVFLDSTLDLITYGSAWSYKYTSDYLASTYNPTYLNSGALIDARVFNAVTATYFYDEATIPEPSAIALMGLGLLGFVATRRRKFQA